MCLKYSPSFDFQLAFKGDYFLIVLTKVMLRTLGVKLHSLNLPYCITKSFHVFSQHRLCHNANYGGHRRLYARYNIVFVAILPQSKAVYKKSQPE